jgi:hypothetical protein
LSSSATATARTKTVNVLKNDTNDDNNMNGKDIYIGGDILPSSYHGNTNVKNSQFDLQNRRQQLSAE